MPRWKLICLDDIAGVKRLHRWAVNDCLGMQHHDMVEICLFLGATHNFQILQQLAQNPLMPQALLNRGRNTKLTIFILDGEFTMIVDLKVA